jgi:hypothetical protein
MLETGVGSTVNLFCVPGIAEANSLKMPKVREKNLVAKATLINVVYPKP